MANYYEEIVDPDTGVRTRIRNSSYVTENLQLKSFTDNGVYVSDAIELLKLEDANSNIEKSLIWKKKKIVELIHSKRFQVRQQVNIIMNIYYDFSDICFD
jgi:hypothetical protein